VKRSTKRRTRGKKVKKERSKVESRDYEEVDKRKRRESSVE